MSLKSKFRKPAMTVIKDSREAFSFPRALVTFAGNSGVNSGNVSRASIRNEN